MATTKWRSQFNMLLLHHQFALYTPRVGKFPTRLPRSHTEISFPGFVNTIIFLKAALPRFSNLCSVFFHVWLLLRTSVVLNWGTFRPFVSGRSLNKDWVRGRVKHIPHQHHGQQSACSASRVRKFSSWRKFSQLTVGSCNC